MYFNPQVKEKREDFFNFEALQQELKGAVENRLIPLIVVSGLRRTGKTSLIRVVLNAIGRKYIWLDGRSILSQEDFYSRLFSEAKKLKLFKLTGFSLKGITLDINLSKDGLEHLNKQGAILVIDEAQLLKRLKLDNAVAYIYDNFPRIKIILSGSETGMLASFIGRDNANAPLYGRAVFELKSQRLIREGSFRFLHEGAKQAKLNFTETEITEAVNGLDGIIGWLTKYGWHRLSISHKQALRKTIDEGKYIVKEEFARFAIRSEKRYWAILGALKQGAGWGEIMKKVPISSKQLNSMLKRMIAYGFVEKHDQVYTIADPLLEAAL